MESVLKRTRRKAHFFLKGEKNQENTNHFSLSSNKTPPTILELKPFEEDVLKLSENIKFRDTKNHFQENLANDLKKINSSNKIFVFADKTRNIYETSLDTYNKLLHDNITKTYKHGSEDNISEINNELKHIADKLSIGNRIECMKKREAFISLKDHKENFEKNPKCRLINPAKSDSGKISKLILDKVNTHLRTILNVNQWRNMQNVIEWFGNIEQKSRHSFISFDIVDFYPSISENLLDQALSWASSLAEISHENISIIKHARKSLLFNNGKPWIKNNNSNLFDVTMGSYDGAEICELVGLFILNHLGNSFGKENIGLYRDDGLAIIKNKSARLADKTRKELHKAFEQFGLKITAESNLHVVNFLDATFDPSTGKYKPYRKPNDDPLYINKHSNHPPSILRQLPTSINKRISTLSSDKQTFEDAAPAYQNALGHSNFSHRLEYTPHETQRPRRNRQGNVIWFNPPFSKNIKTSIALRTKHYIGMTSSTFKERYRNHIKSFTHKKYSNETELSKHIWHLKQNKTDFTIKWSIMKKSISYTGGSKRCNLCLEEKLNILKEKDNCLLNKRSEIISACQHKNRFQVKSLNKERNACYFNDNAPTFPP